MDNKTIFILTREGEVELKSRTGYLSEDLKRVLLLVDGKSAVGVLKNRAAPSLRSELFSLLWKLVDGGYIAYADKSAVKKGQKGSPSNSRAGPLSLLRNLMNGGLVRYVNKVRNMPKKDIHGKLATGDIVEVHGEGGDPAPSSEVRRPASENRASEGAKATAEIEAKANAARVKAAQEAAALQAQIEIAEAEAEAALFKASQEAAAARAELELAEAEAETAHFKAAQEEASARAKIDVAKAHAEAEARILAEAEEARLRAKKEAAAAKVQLEMAKAAAEAEAVVQTKPRVEAENVRNGVKDRVAQASDTPATSDTPNSQGGRMPVGFEFLSGLVPPYPQHNGLFSNLRKKLFRPPEDSDAQPPSDLVSATAEDGSIARTDGLSAILQTLHTSTPGIEASALISSDGLVIASVFDRDMDVTRIGAMTATLLSLGTRAGTELHRGKLRDVIVSGEQGYAVMVGAGRGVSLLVLATETTPLGLIFLEIEEAVNAIKLVA